MDNVTLGFVLVTISGLCTVVGASLVLCTKCVILQNKLILASSLGLSSGVMLYVSFVEIIGKSMGAFEEAGVRGDSGSGLVYLWGTLCFFGGVILMMMVDKLVHCLDRDHAKRGDIISQNTNVLDGSGRKLKKMGLMTALAIGIHNFPEGLATFVATLQDPNIGAALAIAIGIHNIPEGLCVSIPIYYASGSRMRALGWALLSGLTEPLGALIGYVVLSEHMGPMAFGIVFGFLGGMMVYICLHELIPMAYRYDPHNKVTIHSIILGMVIMATSLVLFVVDKDPTSISSCSNVSLSSG